MSDTAEFLEREIENHRANVEETLDKLKERLSVDQVVDDIGQFIGIDDVRGTLAGAGRQLRDNPVALGLIGVGLAWLVLGSSRPEAHHEGSEEADVAEKYRPYSGAWPATSGAPSGMDHTRAREAVKGGAKRAREMAEDAADRVADAAGGLRDRAGKAAASVEERAGEAARGAKHRAAERLSSGMDEARQHLGPMAARLGRHPLLLGGLALLAGAVIGSALPRTRAEDRLMGAPGDRLRDEVKAAARGMAERAADAAQDTYEAAVDAAEDEGLLPDPVGTLAAKLGTVAEAAVDEARAHVEPVLHGEGEASEPKTAKARA